MGLVACLNFQGNMIPAETAVEILDNCEVIKQMPIREFGSGSDYGRGSAWAELMYEDGLKFEYPKKPTPAQKKGAVLKACQRFQIDFNNNSKWENLEKWPW